MNEWFSHSVASNLCFLGQKLGQKEPINHPQRFLMRPARGSATRTRHPRVCVMHACASLNCMSTMANCISFWSYVSFPTQLELPHLDLCCSSYGQFSTKKSGLTAQQFLQFLVFLPLLQASFPSSKSFLPYKPWNHLTHISRHRMVIRED